MAKKPKIDQPSPEDAVEIVSQEIDEPTDPIEDTVEAEAVSEAEVLPEAEPISQETQQRSTVFPMLLGGVLSAAIGFGAAQYLMPGGIFFQGENQELVAIRAQLADVETNVATLMRDLKVQNEASQAQVAAQFQTQTDVNTAFQQSQSEIMSRIDAIEKRPIADAGAEVQAALQSYVAELARVNEVLTAQGAEIGGFQSRVAALEGQLAAKLAVVNEQKTAAEAADKTARLRSLFNALKGELDTGRAFGPTLTAIAEVTGNAAPADLSANSDGVASLSSLQSRFPDAARATLAVAIAETAEPSAMGRFSAFLKSQTGARSLSAKEGSDPDAVLSRAEAALKRGDVPSAIKEISALPAGGSAKIAPWVEKAQAYADTQAAFTTYSTTTLSN